VWDLIVNVQGATIRTPYVLTLSVFLARTFCPRNFRGGNGDTKKAKQFWRRPSPRGSRYLSSQLLLGRKEARSLFFPPLSVSVFMCRVGLTKVEFVCCVSTPALVPSLPSRGSSHLLSFMSSPSMVNPPTSLCQAPGTTRSASLPAPVAASEATPAPPSASGVEVAVIPPASAMPVLIARAKEGKKEVPPLNLKVPGVFGEHKQPPQPQRLALFSPAAVTMGRGAERPSPPGSKGEFFGERRVERGRGRGRAALQYLCSECVCVATPF
jgi:hypothetical protein